MSTQDPTNTRTNPDDETKYVRPATKLEDRIDVQDDDPNPANGGGYTPPQPPADRDDEPAEGPKLFVDPRLEMGRRQMQERQHRDATAKSLEILPPDVLAAVQGQQADDDLDPMEREARDRANGKPPAQQQQQQQPAGGKPETVRLLVNGAPMEVSRQDAIRYADLDGEDVSLYTDTQIARMAQRGYASLVALEEAKRLRKAALAGDSVDPTPGQNPPQDGDELDPNDAHPRRRNQPPSRDELVDALQYGDAATAGERLDAYLEARLSGVVETQRAVTQVEQVRENIRTTLADFEVEHADIAENPDAKEFAVLSMIGEVRKDLEKIGVDPRLTRAMNQDQVLQAYTLALKDGYPMRDPRVVAETAVSRTRQVHNMPTPRQVTPTPQQQSGLQSRENAKRGLISQPQGGGGQSPGVGNARPQSVEDHRRSGVSNFVAQKRAMFSGTRG